MAKKEYIPTFPYKGDQAIISSGRIIFHAKDDSIFLFGKKAVGISSVGVVNIDNYEGTSINSPKIELGLNAKTGGEAVMLGESTNDILIQILEDLASVGDALATLSQTGLAASSIIILSAGERMRNNATRLKNALAVSPRRDAYNLSKITFTR